MALQASSFRLRRLFALPLVVGSGMVPYASSTATAVLFVDVHNMATEFGTVELRPVKCCFFQQQPPAEDDCDTPRISDPVEKVRRRRMRGKEQADECKMNSFDEGNVVVKLFVCIDSVLVFVWGSFLLLYRE